MKTIISKYLNSKPGWNQHMQMIRSIQASNESRIDIKKRIAVKVCFIVAAVLAAGSVCASSRITTSTTIGRGIFAPSNGVTLNVAATDSGYAGYSWHLKGDRVFFMNNSDTKGYYKNKTVGSVFTNTPHATDTAPRGFIELATQSRPEKTRHK
jgi:hypothetical protein